MAFFDFRFYPVRRQAAGIMFAAVVGAGVGAVVSHPAAYAAVLATVTSAVSCATTSACVAGNNTSAGPGVSGTSASGYGVSGTSKSNYGVEGISSTNDGLKGVSMSSNGLSASSTTGYGVKGVSSTSIGVFGQTSSSTQAAVVGTTSATASTAVGVSGLSAEGTGVNGQSSDGIGVSGQSDVGTGVRGQSPGGTAVYGLGSYGYGVEGQASTGVGIYGLAVAGDGVYAQSDSGTALYSTSNGGAAVSAYSAAGTSALLATAATGNGSDIYGSVMGMIGRAPAKGGFPLVLTDQDGNTVFEVDGVGDVSYTGSLRSLAHVKSGGTIASYMTQATLPTVEDTGTAQLIGGTATVALDGAFAASIDMSSAYRVFITPNGDTRGLFVPTKTLRGFVVREAQGGRSNVTFDYRIIATAAGQTGKRMGYVSASFLKSAPLSATRFAKAPAQHLKSVQR